MPRPTWLGRATTKTSSTRERALREGYRSGFEMNAATQLRAAGVPVAYEEFVVDYDIPARKAKYTADFRLPNGVIVETKGRFVTADRKKHKLIREQRPDLDIRILFQNPNARISKASKTTYAKWCQDHDIKFAKAVSKDNPIPPEWMK